MRVAKKTSREVQSDYLRFLGASKVEFIEPGDEVIVVATFEKRFVLQPYDLDALEQITGIRPDIGFDNTGTDTNSRSPKRGRKSALFENSAEQETSSAPLPSMRYSAAIFANG